MSESITNVEAAVAEYGALPVPVGTEPSFAKTLEKRTELLRSVQATARRQAKEIAGRKAHGDRLKAENVELTAELHQARQYIRAVELTLADKTPFWPKGADAVLRTIGWLRNSLDDYRSRVDTAETFARRTQARISALLVEPVDPQGCAVCGMPEDGHGVRVTEGFEHEWKRPTDTHVRERQLMQREFERTASGDAHPSELAWLRRRVAELEAERHSTNEALDDAVKELRRREDGVYPQGSAQRVQQRQDDDPARCLKVHEFSPRDGWRMVCSNCDHGKGADCHQGGAS